MKHIDSHSCLITFVSLNMVKYSSFPHTLFATTLCITNHLIHWVYYWFSHTHKSIYSAHTHCLILSPPLMFLFLFSLQYLFFTAKSTIFSNAFFWPSIFFPYSASYRVLSTPLPEKVIIDRNSIQKNQTNQVVGGERRSCPKKNKKSKKKVCCLRSWLTTNFESYL